MRSLTEPMQRFGQSVERAVLGLVVAVVRAIATVVLTFLIMAPRLTKPLILYPLILAMMGGVGAAIAFGLNRHWTDAAEAFSIGLLAWVITTAYSALARRLDPTFFDESPLPPWWWYL